ncbi:MAG: M28 family peptidase [bacterium]|nr:M28 family peptidase [bacterium]
MIRSAPRLLLALAPIASLALGPLAIAPAQSAFPAPHDLPDDRSTGAQSVDVAGCKDWLYTLASPEFAGRQTGHPGFAKAAEFVSAHFRELGLRPMGQNGSFYQRVPWSRTAVDAEATYFTLEKDGKEVLRIPADRLGGTASATVSAAGEVVLLVVTPPERPQNPRGGRRFSIPKIEGLADLDLEGKIVLAHIKPGGDRMSNALMRFALRRGLSGTQPAAVLFANTEQPTGLRDASSSRRSTNPAAAGRRRRPGETSFGGEDLDRILTFAGLHRDVLEGTELAPEIPKFTAKLEIAVKEADAPAMNVVAVLPGSDPEFADEYVVIGSHLDHVGMGGGLHPGADDDASGTTGVMAIAKMFATNPIKPRRSILFVCFAGEEDGLVGSRFFVRNPPIPLAAIVAELQMDMIGRDEEANRESKTPEERNEKAEDNRTSLHLVGTKQLAPALHELCLAKNSAAGFSIEYDQEGMFGRSDHANFARMGVPVAFFFTGLHRDYHETTDTPDKIHYEKLLRVATYVYDIAFDLARQDGRPEIDAKLWAKMRNKSAQQPAAPVMTEESKDAPTDEKSKGGARGK